MVEEILTNNPCVIATGVNGFPCHVGSWESASFGIATAAIGLLMVLFLKWKVSTHLYIESFINCFKERSL
jgi:hypothetical protein